MNRTPTPPAGDAIELPIGCWRLNCGRAAVIEVLEQMMGEYKPCCRDHSRNATPFETRPLQHRRTR